MNPQFVRPRSHVVVRLASEIVLIAGSVWLFSIAITELIRSFTIYRGYEVPLIRGPALLLLLLAAVMAYMGAKMIRSSRSRWFEG
ncbi:hypothetical protein BH23ACT4_BH23ACT4_13910 [soil metagenome]